MVVSHRCLRVAVGRVERALVLARKLLQVNPGVAAGLFFTGTPGVGKTHLSVALAKEFLKVGVLPLYLTPENYFEVGQKIGSHSVFIVDDFNQVVGLYRQEFLKVLMAVHARGGRLLVTSTTPYEKILADIAAIEGAHGARYCDRIKGLLVPLVIEAPSGRAEKVWLEE